MVIINPLVHRVDVQNQLPDGTDLGTPQAILFRTLVEIHRVPIRQPPGSAQVFQRVIHVQIRHVSRKLRVPRGFRFQRRCADVVSSTIDVHIVADSTADGYRPLNWAVCEQRHLPVPLRQLVQLLRLLLKLGAVNNLGQVFHETLVVHLFVEVACVQLETRRESSSRVTVTEVQHAIRLPGIFAFGQLGSDVPDAVVLEMFHEQRRSQNYSIDIEQE